MRPALLVKHDVLACRVMVPSPQHCPCEILTDTEPEAEVEAVLQRSLRMAQPGGQWHVACDRLPVCAVLIRS